MLRDGFHQHAVHAGVAPYRPNSLDGGNPFLAGDAEHAFLDVPVTVAEAPKVRANPASFDDHFSQARLFWLSMSPVEQEHIVRAYTFELGKCYEQAIKERQLRCLANIDPELCTKVAAGLGLPRRSRPCRSPTSRPARRCPRSAHHWPIDGRIVGIVVGPDADLDGRRPPARRAVFAAGMVPLLIAPHGGTVGGLRCSGRSPPPGPSSSTRSCSPRRRAGRGRPARPRRQGRRRGRRRVDPRSCAGRRVLAARQDDRRLGRGPRRAPERGYRRTARDRHRRLGRPMRWAPSRT